MLPSTFLDCLISNSGFLISSSDLGCGSFCAHRVCILQREQLHFAWKEASVSGFSMLRNGLKHRNENCSLEMTFRSFISKVISKTGYIYSLTIVEACRSSNQNHPVVVFVYNVCICATILSETCWIDINRIVVNACATNCVCTFEYSCK